MKYIQPTLTVISVETEKGFAGTGTTGGSTPEYEYGNETWD